MCQNLNKIKNRSCASKMYDQSIFNTLLYKHMYRWFKEEINNVIFDILISTRFKVQTFFGHINHFVIHLYNKNIISFVKWSLLDLNGVWRRWALKFILWITKQSFNWTFNLSIKSLSVVMRIPNLGKINDISLNKGRVVNKEKE